MMTANFSAIGLTSGDSGELSSASCLLNIPHYGSSQLYCLINKIFIGITSLFKAEPIRVTNILSSLYFSLSMLIILIILGELDIEILLSLALTAFVSTSFIANISFITEIYSLNLLFFTSFLLFLIKFQKSGRINNFYLSFFLFLLSLSIHISNLVFFPVFLIILFINRKKIDFPTVFFILFIGLTPFLYLIIRSYGECIWKFGLSSPKDLFSYLSGGRKEVTTWFFSGSIHDLIIKIKQFLIINIRFSQFIIIFFFSQFFFRFKRNLFLPLLGFALLNFLFFIITPALPIQKYYFYIPSLICIFLIGLPVITIFNNKKFSIIFSIIIIFASIINYYQLEKHSRRNDFLIESWIANTVDLLPYNSILLVNGDELTFPMFYNNYIRKNTKKIKVINRSMMDIPWYKEYMKKFLKIDSEKFKKRLFEGNAKNTFSESILNDYSAHNFFNNYAHLYKIEPVMFLYTAENKVMWKNIRFPLYKPLDEGEARIKKLYSENLRNYAVSLAENLDFSDASYFGSLSASIQDNHLIREINNTIRENASLYEHYLKLPDGTQEKLDIAIKLNSPSLIEIQSGLIFSQNGNVKILKLYLNSLARQKKWGSYKEICNRISSKSIRLTELLRLNLILKNKDECKKIIEKWESSFAGDDGILLLKAQYLILVNDIDSLSNIIERLPDNNLGNNFRALFFYKSGKIKKAYSIWSKILSEDPENLQAKIGIKKITGPSLGKI